MVGPQHMCKVRTIDRISKLIFDEQGRNWHEEKADPMARQWVHKLLCKMSELVTDTSALFYTL